MCHVRFLGGSHHWVVWTLDIGPPASRQPCAHRRWRYHSKCTMETCTARCKPEGLRWVWGDYNGTHSLKVKQSWYVIRIEGFCLKPQNLSRTCPIGHWMLCLAWDSCHPCHPWSTAVTARLNMVHCKNAVQLLIVWPRSCNLSKQIIAS